MPDSIRHVVERSGDFMAAHERWVAESRIDPRHRSAHEHKVLSKALKLGAQVHGLNLKQSEAFECILRRRQLLQEAHKDDPTKPNFESAHHYLGEDDEGGGTAMSQAMPSHVATELSREATIEKEKRKAREAKEAKTAAAAKAKHKPSP